MSLGVAALTIVTPFSIHNFIQGRYLLSVFSLAIVAILAYNAWSIRQGRYYPLLTLLGLAPAILFFLMLAIRKQGIIGYLWCYPAVISFYILLPERKALIANVFLLVLSLSQAWDVLEPSVAARVAATLFTVSIFSVIFIRVITQQQRRLEELVVTDTLTGLYNRTLLHTILEEAIHQNNRTGIPMTLIIMDLDHFKSINDTLGHNTGDAVLHGIGQLLRKRLRRTDKVFRLGGEEFLALLYGTDAKNSLRVAEELRCAIASLPLLPDRSVTVSIGIATLVPRENWMEWMKRGDENLYRAKASGRNRVVS